MTRDREKCPLSTISGLILEKPYEPFVGANKTVRYIRVSLLTQVSVKLADAMLVVFIAFTKCHDARNLATKKG